MKLKDLTQADIDELREYRSLLVEAAKEVDQITDALWEGIEEYLRTPPKIESRKDAADAMESIKLLNQMRLNDTKLARVSRLSATLGELLTDNAV